MLFCSAFVDPFCNLCFVFVLVILFCLLLSALWSLAGKGLASWISCVRCFLVFFHFSIWCPVSGVVLECIDS